MHRLFFIAFILISGSLWSQCDAMQKLYQEGRYSDLTETFQAAEEPCVHQWLADAFHKQGDLMSALSHYEQAISVDPQNARLFVHQGICRFSLEDYSASRSDLISAHELGSSDKRIPYYLGACSYMEGDYDNCLAYLEDALRSDPAYYDALYLKGACQVELGKPTSAEGTFQKCMDINPDDYLLKINLAISLSDQFRFDDARAILDELAKVHEDEIAMPAYYQRGLLRYQTHDKDGACEDWANAADLGDADAQRLIDEICEGKKKKVKDRKKVYVSF